MRSRGLRGQHRSHHAAGRIPREHLAALTRREGRTSRGADIQALDEDGRRRRSRNHLEPQAVAVRAVRGLGG
jgi:hypothetical protein